MYKTVSIWFLGLAPAWSAELSDLNFVVASSLPSEFRDYLRSSKDHDAYALSDWLNPFYVQADFNGDGQIDTAVLIEEKATGKRGLLVAHIGAEEHYIIGAGNPVGSGGDDFSWMDAWHVFPRGQVSQSAHVDALPPELIGDALLVIKVEAASGIVYWTGERYEWYQQAD